MHKSNYDGPAFPWFVAFTGILLIPFPYYLIPFHTSIIQWLFVPPASWIAKNIFGVNSFVPEISSDSVLMYVLVLIIVLLALAAVFLCRFITRKNKLILFSVIRTVAVYYLALHLLKYGADKVFKGQFYMPEPNTLYTPLGELSRDLMLWSTLGSSYTYNILTGSLEIVAGLLLLWGRTRIAGGFLSLIILVNIVILNFSFDISVKLFSLFLLYINVLILWPHFKRIARFFGGLSITSLVKNSFPGNAGVRAALKFFITAIIIVEAAYPYAMNNSFNDDLARRPELHGAYEVTGSDNAGFNEDSTFAARRIFVHREGYLIFQDNKNVQKSFRILPSVIPGRMNVVDFKEREYKLGFNYKDSVLNIQYPGNETWIKARALNWRALPALKPSFHWVVDGDHAL